MTMMTLYGAPPSPFVRKAMLTLAYKQLPYEVKLTFPGSDDPEFRAASHLGKIPALRTDDGAAFSDSSVIAAYLERVDQTHPLYPADNNDFARALWLEEYADTKMMEATAGLYFQLVLGPRFFKHQTDPQRVDELKTKLIPAALDYIESQMSEQGWLVNNTFSIADITVGTNLVNLQQADFHIEPQRWPKLVAYNDQFMAEQNVKKQIAMEIEAMRKHAS